MGWRVDWERGFGRVVYGRPGLKKETEEEEWPWQPPKSTLQRFPKHAEKSFCDYTHLIINTHKIHFSHIRYPTHICHSVSVTQDHDDGGLLRLLTFLLNSFNVFSSADESSPRQNWLHYDSCEDLEGNGNGGRWNFEIGEKAET